MGHDRRKKGMGMIKEAIITLSKKDDLDYAAAETVMDEIMGGKATPVQMSSYLTAMSLKGPTIDEITASVSGMRKHCVRLLHDMDVLEIVGTGGDGSHSINISTMAAIIAAASGVPVAKHGNRAASSSCGSADVLEALGVRITLPPEKSAQMLEEIGICFLFAQNYHIAMKYVAPVRRELGIRTIFNILGPLANPAGAKKELLGVYDSSLVEPITQVLLKLGVHDAMVVFGLDGLDEISISAPTKICEIKNGWIKSYEITPEQFGFERSSPAALKGGSPEENAQAVREIFGGKKDARRNAVVLNAAAALCIAGTCCSLEKAVPYVEDIIDSGKAERKLRDFIEASQSL